MGITAPGQISGGTVVGPTSVSTPSVTIATTSVTAPGGVTTPQVARSGSPAPKVDFPTGVSTTDVTGSGAIQGATVKGTTSVNTPSVDITTTAITAPGQISGGTVVSPTSVSTPSVTIGTTSVTAPGGVTTPQVSVSGSPAPKIAFPTGVSTPAVTAPGGVTTPQVVRSPAAKVDFPTGVSTPSLTAPSIDGLGQQIYTQNDGYVNVIIDASDRRLKRNLSGIKDSLDKVLRLKGLYFNWIEDDVSGIRTGDKSRRHLGLIAQDVKEVVPEAVSEIGKDNKYLGVNYNALIGLLVEAMKEMHLRVEKLERDTRTLREAS